MQANFLRALARVLAYEGGKVNDPRDPGGKTNQGITQSTFNAYLCAKGQLMRDVYTMGAQERDDIYKTNYWDVVQADKLPTGLDLVLFDAAVNSGPAQATKWLQASLGGVTVDGFMGNKTLNAIDASQADDLIESVCARRMAMLQHLSTWGAFGVGWAARVANVQKTALSWDSRAPSPPAAPNLSGVGGQAKARVQDVLNPSVSQITAQASTMATGVATVAAQAAQAAQPFQDTFVWAKYAFGGLTILGMAAGVVAMLSTKAHDAVVAGSATAVVDLEADTRLPTVPDVYPADKVVSSSSKGV